MHVSIPAKGVIPSLLSRPPTCAHVMPRHEYVDSSAALTAAASGFVPETYAPVVWS